MLTVDRIWTGFFFFNFGSILSVLAIYTTKMEEFIYCTTDRFF